MFGNESNFIDHLEKNQGRTNEKILSIFRAFAVSEQI